MKGTCYRMLELTLLYEFMDKIKWKQNILRDRSAIILLSSIILISSVFLVDYEDYRTVELSNEEYDSGQIDIIDRYHYIEQTIVAQEEGLNCINILLTTNGRINNCLLKATLSDDDSIIYTWNINGNLLLDNSFYPLKLDKPIKDSKAKAFKLRITSDGIGDDKVGYHKRVGDGIGLTINGKSRECEELIYSCNYKKSITHDVKPYFYRFICGLIITSALFFLILNYRPNITKCFIILWGGVSVFYAISNPPLNAPDEMVHFYRAYEISLGYMVSDFNEQIVDAGRELPIEEDITILQRSWADYDKNKTISISDKSFFYCFSSSSVYAPISYLPQSIGIYLSRLFTNSIVKIIYVARICNWLFITLLLYRTISIIPVGKEIVFLICFIPVNISECVSLAPDGLVVAGSMYILAYTMKLRCECSEKLLIIKDYIVITFMSIFIAFCKIVYLPFALYWLLIPSERFKNGIKGKIIMGSLIAFSVSAASLSWLKICSKFLVRRGTDCGLQLMYLMNHPIQYYLIIVRTLIRQGCNLTLSAFGMNVSRTEVVGIMILIYFYFFVKNVFCHEKNARNEFEIDYSLRYVSVAVTLIVFLLINTSLYLQWTMLFSNEIVGLQGRYFIPLLLPMFFIVNPLIKSSIGAIRQKDNLSVVLLGAIINICACTSIFFGYLE